MKITTNSTRPFRRTSIALATVAAAGMALAGCAQAEDTASDAATAAGDAASSAGDAASDTTEDATTDGADSSATANNESALSAVDVALAEFPDTRALDFEREDDGYNVDVTDGTTVHELSFGNDGTSVQGAEQDDLDPEDATELTAATVEMKDAVETALEEQPGTLMDVELATEDGQVRWEVEVENGGKDTEVWVSATEGTVLGRDN